MKIIHTITASFLTLALFSAALPISTAHADSKRYKRTVEKYQIPDVSLVNQDGKKVRLATLLTGDQPVIVDFIYGTCTTICPVLSAGFANLQRKLGPASSKVRMISITIDPENDTPKVLKEYLKRYRGQPGWDFLTGSRADIDAVMRGFNAYIPDKMSHYPINLIRNPKDGSWVRLFGMLSSREFLEEFQNVSPTPISGLKP
jgi:protein SCO1